MEARQGAHVCAELPAERARVFFRVWVADAVAYSPMTHIQLLIGVGRLLWSPDTAGWGCGVPHDEAVMPVPGSLGGIWTGRGNSSRAVPGISLRSEKRAALPRGKRLKQVMRWRIFLLAEEVIWRSLNVGRHLGDVEKAQLEIDPGAQLPSRSLCGWRIPERGVSSRQAQEENARAPIGLLEAVSREDGPGWLRAETARHSGVLGGGAGEEPGWWAGNGGSMPPARQGRGKEAAAFLQVGMLRHNRWLNQAVRKKMDGRWGKNP
ncbi:uncharacterized protein LOC115343956 [Aquila chrysaetos chrysaetos]|uniref:uncharacterized protein LOC115343956 n=1 Tax=Aquila chrysaetos chrysaetos TaxID=223781 RepID=UPI00117728A8|nr:uncharacterized protein LOC115343956 [Aquila chrysaetos chrysaetos]